MTKFFITGSAGFIGSSLADRLLSLGHEVVGYDNFSTGFEAFISQVRENPRFLQHHGDLQDLPALTSAMRGCDFVFHLAANADVRFGTQQPRKDLDQNTFATWNVLEAMRSCGIRRIAFSSTGSIYGEPKVHPTPENAPFPVQTSLYGASKLAAEGLIQAYCEGFGFQGYIFRFVSILGERYTHGHVFDFLKQLSQHPDRLFVLGNGRQRKSYLYVQDCLDAVLLALEKATDKINIFNLGTDEYCEVNDSIACICETMKLNPTVEYGGGERGWIGDSPFIFLDCSKMRTLGWNPKLRILEGVARTVQYIQSNPWVMTQRDQTTAAMEATT
jgi:UDP-glucose 4-epimerase